jgi:hypothetical protein
MTGMIRLGQTFTKDFTLRSPTGLLSDADSTPTCAVYEDTTTTAILSPTCTKRGTNTGNYYFQVAVTTANGFEIGKSYNIRILATVGGVQDAAIVDTFVIDTPIRPSGLVVSDAGNSATQFKTDLVDTTTDCWKDGLVLFATGALAGQVKKCTAYAGGTKIISFTNGYTGTPSNGDVFEIINI